MCITNPRMKIRILLAASMLHTTTEPSDLSKSSNESITYSDKPYSMSELNRRVREKTDAGKEGL